MTGPAPHKPLPTPDQLAAARGLVAGTGIPVMPSPADPMAVARELLGDHRHGPRADAPLTLRFWRGDWQQWDGPAWSVMDQSAIRSWLYLRLECAKYLHQAAKTGEPEERPWQPNKTKIAHVSEALAAICELSDRVDPPAWIGEGKSAPTSAFLSCSNGLLDLSTRSLRLHTPDLFNRVAVPFAHDPHAPEPSRWLTFLKTLWPHDPEAISALAEWFGYVLSGRTEQHKIMLLVGPPRSGKGTIARVLQNLVGRGNYANPTLSSLGTNFGLAPLVDSPLAVIGDARLGQKVDSSTVVERLLSISGEDGLTVDRKHRDAWTGRLPTRFMILSNELPRLGDTSGAIASRFLVLTLQESFRGREDVALGQALDAELPGILNWALDGLDRLTERGAFVEPQSSRDAVQALEDLVSPISAFLRDRCEVGGSAPADAVWDAWRTWAVANGLPVGSTQTLGRNLRSQIPALATTQPRDPVTGKQIRHYVGIRLTEEASVYRPLPSPLTFMQGGAS